MEGSNNGVAGTGASWSYYDAGTTVWAPQVLRKLPPVFDRDTLNLWSATASSFTPTGSKTVSLNADGLTAVRRWLAGGVNNGVVIQLYSGTLSDSLAFDSREGTTAPVLSVTYCVPAPTNHTVTFKANGGTGSDYTQTASTPTALTANTFTRTVTRSAAGPPRLAAAARPIPMARPTTSRLT